MDDDILLKEIVRGRSNVKQDEWKAGYLYAKHLGPCPSFVCTIPLVERAFVQAGINSSTSDWALIIGDPTTFKDSIFASPQYAAWDDHQQQFDSKHYAAGFYEFRSETFRNALVEFQTVWNKLHPQFECEIIGGYIRALIISGTIKNYSK